MKRHNTDCLEIGEFIFDKINGIIEIYPIVAEKSALFPFAVYRRLNFTPRDTKDKYNFEERVTMEIVIATEIYKQSIEFASKIKEALEYFKGIWRNTYITNIRLIDSNEDYINENYIQRMVFEIVIDNDKFNSIQKQIG